MSIEGFGAGGGGDSDEETLKAVSPIPKNAHDFAGNWIAIRVVNGEPVVVAHAKEHDDLAQEPDYDPMDALYFVPPADSQLFLKASEPAERPRVPRRTPPISIFDVGEGMPLGRIYPNDPA